MQDCKLQNFATQNSPVIFRIPMSTKVKTRMP